MLGIIERLLFIMTTQQIQDEWFTGQKVSGASFALNEVVRISAGSHAGKIGSVISLLVLGPQPRYIVETSSGRDIEMFEYELEKYDA